MKLEIYSTLLKLINEQIDETYFVCLNEIIISDNKNELIILIR